MRKNRLMNIVEIEKNKFRVIKEDKPSPSSSDTEEIEAPLKSNGAVNFWQTSSLTPVVSK